MVDCRGKTLYDLCKLALVGQVNSINWTSVPEYLAAEVLSAAHKAGTISDKTAQRIASEGTLPNFLSGENWGYSVTLNMELEYLAKGEGRVRTA